MGRLTTFVLVFGLLQLGVGYLVTDTQADNSQWLIQTSRNLTLPAAGALAIVWGLSSLVARRRKKREEKERKEKEKTEKENQKNQPEKEAKVRFLRQFFQVARRMIKWMLILGFLYLFLGLPLQSKGYVPPNEAQGVTVGKAIGQNIRIIGYFWRDFFLDLFAGITKSKEEEKNMEAPAETPEGVDQKIKELEEKFKEALKELQRLLELLQEALQREKEEGP